MPYRKNVVLALASVLLAAVLLLCDRVAPETLPGGILYLALVLPGLWYHGPKLLIASGCLATSLNLIALLAAPPGASSADVTERLVSTLAVWIAVAIACKWKNEQTRAERIEQERARLAATLGTLDDAVLGLNLDGVIESWSPGAERLYGYSAGEVVGRPVSLLVSPDRANDFYQSLAEAGKGASAQRIETVRLSKAGTRLDISLKLSPVLGPDGRLSGILSVEWDISKEKHVERELRSRTEDLERAVSERTTELRKAEALSHDLYDNSPDLMVMTLPGSGKITSCNQALADALGRSKEDLIGSQYLDLYEPEMQAKAKATFASFAKTGKVLDPYRTLRLANGRAIDAFLQVTTVRDDDGTTIAIRSTWRDISDLKKAEREIAARELLYRTLIETVPHIIFQTDDAGHITFFNRAWQELTGRKAEESLGMHWVDSVHSEDRPGLLDSWMQAHGRIEPFHVRFRLQAKEGKFRDMECSGAPVRDLDGKIVSWVVQCLDLTEHNAVERELRQNQEHLRLVLEAGRVGTWITNLSTQMVFCDLGYRKIYGLETEDAVIPRAVLLSQIHPEDRARVAAAPAHSIASGEPLAIEFRLLWPDGTIRHVATRGSVVRDEAGRPTEIAGVSIDITALKRAEEELRESREQLRLALESGNIGTWIWNVAEKTVISDPGARRMLALEEAEVETDRRRFLARVHPDDAARWEAALDCVCRQGGGFEQEIRVVCADGTNLYVVVRAAVPTDGGNPLKVRGVVIDVTDRVRARQKLAAANEQLARTNEDLEQFAYIASHDLKAPLRAIANLAEWIEEDLATVLSGETRENMDLLRQRVQRLEQLIDDLLKYSRAGRARESLTLVDTAELIQELVALLQPPAGFTIQVAPGMPVFRAAKTPLSQVFANLIGNAIKHHDRPNGRVEIAFSESDERYEFVVSDDGPGIPPELHERAFQIFRTLKPRDEVEGSGVGLAIVKRLVEHHGGVVSLKSAQGQGAAFRFTWPKKIEQTTSYESQLESRQPAASRA